MTNEEQKKYIEEEKLKDKIKSLQCEQGFDTGEAERAYQFAIKDILDIITSLQQEQTELPGYNKALLEVKSKVDELYEETSIGLSEYDSGLYNGIAETCMKLRGFIKARLNPEIIGEK